jgi:hypothetical protein
MSALRRGALLFGVLLAATWVHGATAPVPLPPTPPRPGAEAGPAKVGYAVWLGDVKQIDGVAQTFSVSFVVAMRWHDPQLAHAGPGAKQYSLDDIWHPRLLILNEAGDTERSLPEVADVAPDGTAVYRQRLIGTFSQSLNLRAFPFDRDTFRVPFVSLGHRPAEVAFAPDEMAIAAGMREGIGLPEKLTIQDWRVESATTRASPLHVTPGVELASFAFEFTAARRAHHFIIKVIIPLILIVAMSWAVFWIEPTDAATQVGVSITAMLTLIAYRFAVDSDVPKLPYLTKLDAFILMSTVLVFLSLIEVMVTTKLANRNRTELARAIDRRCRWIFPLVFAIATTLTFLIH